MDLLQLMDTSADHREKALDRLEGIVALYVSDDGAVREEAMGRALVFCGKEWGGYAAGLEALAARKDARNQGLEALRLREEAADPGFLIREIEAVQAESAKMSAEKRAVIARYGSETAALGPTPLELMFVSAAQFLAEDGTDPWAPLAGWSIPWHPLPAVLAETVTAACPLPANLADARAESRAWEERLAELEVLAEGQGAPMLPTACAARHQVVRRLLASDLPVRSVAELQIRLEHWRDHGGGDTSGYTVLERDVQALMAQGVTIGTGEGTKAKCRRLHQANPDWSLARIGKEVGISRQAVHKHLKG